MADSDSGYVDTVGDMPEHEETYGAFMRMVIAGSLGCVLILITLAAVGFGSFTVAMVTTFGMFVGLMVIFISLLAGISFTPSIVIIAGVTLLALVL